MVKGTLLGDPESVAWQSCSVMEFPNPASFVDYFLGDLEMQRRRATFTENVRIVILEPFD
jgi:hypothetical protein